MGLWDEVMLQLSDHAGGQAGVMRAYDENHDNEGLLREDMTCS